MTEPVVRLDEFGLTSLKIDWHNPIPDGEDVSSDLNVGYTVGVLHEDPCSYRLTLTVRDTRISPDHEPLASIEATMVGFFTFPEATPEVDRGRVIRVNGLTMLYGALRGALGTVSGAFPPDFRYVLPAVNMFDVIKSVEGDKSRGSEAEGAQPAHNKAKAKVGKRTAARRPVQKS